VYIVRRSTNVEKWGQHTLRTPNDIEARNGKRSE
jgi:hypothetical protein